MCKQKKKKLNEGRPAILSLHDDDEALSQG